MVGFLRLYVESNDAMLKTGNNLSGRNSGKTNCKLWSVLGNRKKGKTNGRVRSNQEGTFPLRSRQFNREDNVITLNPVNNNEVRFV